MYIASWHHLKKRCLAGYDSVPVNGDVAAAIPRSISVYSFKIHDAHTLGILACTRDSKSPQKLAAHDQGGIFW